VTSIIQAQQDQRVLVSKPLVSTPKVYQKPTLAKGPSLARVTAVPAVSGGGQLGCWVARAAFGEHDIRWLIFRAWLFDDAPTWFRSLYLRYGKAVGSWLAGKHRLRGVVRTMMMPAVRRKARL
jgi:hypothetical protein